MAWRDAGDGQDSDPFASATGTFVIHLFDHDGKRRSNMPQCMADKGKKGGKQDSDKPWQTPVTAGWVDGV